jgi:hypothetical protein
MDGSTVLAIAIRIVGTRFAASSILFQTSTLLFVGLFNATLSRIKALAGLGAGAKPRATETTATKTKRRVNILVIRNFNRLENTCER